MQYLEVLGQLKALFPPNVSQLLQLTLDRQLLDSSVGDLADLITKLVELPGTHAGPGLADNKNKKREVFPCFCSSAAALGLPAW
jgi:hypothetical protein